MNLYTDEEIGRDFIFVPGGTAILGGDVDAYDALPLQETDVADYAIARYSVTHREYRSGTRSRHRLPRRQDAHSEAALGEPTIFFPRPTRKSS